MNHEDANTTKPVTLDGKTFAIGILSVTACVLFVGLLLVTLLPTPAALAIGQSDRGGDYVMLTQQVSNSYEGVIVIDAAAKRLNMYGLHASGTPKELRLMQRNIPLDRLPGAPAPAERPGP
jgi:hypothetical protein